MTLEAVRDASFERIHEQIDRAENAGNNVRVLEELRDTNPAAETSLNIAKLASKFTDDELARGLQTAIDVVTDADNPVQLQYQQGIEVDGPSAQMHLGKMQSELELSK